MSKNVNLLSQVGDDQVSQVYLISQTGKRFPVPFKTLQISNFLNNTNPEEEEDIRIPGVSTKVLEKIIEFCIKYQEEPMRKISKPVRSLDDEVGPWYANFINVENEMLFEITKAANFMQIGPLVDLTCAKIASLIQVS